MSDASIEKTLEIGDLAITYGRINAPETISRLAAVNSDKYSETIALDLRLAFIEGAMVGLRQARDAMTLK